MRRITIALPVGMLLTSCTTVPSGPMAPVYVDMAEVIQAQPLYQDVQVARPVSECWIERVVDGAPRRSGYAAPLAGGIIGGVLGHALARGHARTPLTVAGAALGASLGQSFSAAPRRSPVVRNVRRCATVSRYEQRQQLVGYRVDYRYEGQTFSTRTRSHPGRFIRVRVNVDPVDGT
ncbi:MAG: glycine zipper 2TM domain-containing protein [Gammaproteobacteria bacterium]